MKAIALDLSLAATGAAGTHDHHGRPGVWCRTIHTARTRHGATDIDHDRVHTILSEVAAMVRCEPALVLIEWLPAFAGKGDTTIRLAELHGVARHWLWSKGVRYLDVKPTYVQMWATGKGRATKTAVRTAITATYGSLCHVADDNQADALSMLSLARDAYGVPLAPVLDPRRRAAIKNVTWPDLATPFGPRSR
nr:hypothetical protein [Micromonospora sp. DSM 115978]